MPNSLIGVGPLRGGRSIGSGSIGQRYLSNFTQLGASAEILSVRKNGIDGIKRAIRSNGFDGAVIATASEIRLELISYCLNFTVSFCRKTNCLWSVVVLVFVLKAKGI